MPSSIPVPVSRSDLAFSGSLPGQLLVSTGPDTDPVASDTIPTAKTVTAAVTVESSTDTAGTAATLTLRRQRATGAMVQANDHLGAIYAQGWNDEGVYRNAASVEVFADATPAGSATPGRIEVTTLDVANVRSTRVLINNDGKMAVGTWPIGTSVALAATLGVQGNLAIGSTSYAAAAPPDGLLVQGPTRLLGGLQVSGGMPALALDHPTEPRVLGLRNGQAGFLFNFDGTSFLFGTQAQVPIDFQTGNVIVARLTCGAGAGLGLGTTAPSQRLSLVGAVGFQAPSATTPDQQQAILVPSWADNTQATRKGRLALKVSDASGVDKEGLRIESDGTAARIGFYGATAVARQPAAADTAGAALAAVEAEVNKLKQLLRNYNLMAP